MSEGDVLYRKAAESILSSNFLIVATGAGFSADSGLAVYKDIADVEAYRLRSLEYHDLCTPHWMVKEPELFYGFWGDCYNVYKATKEHDGYGILKKWKETMFHDNAIATEFRREQQRLAADSTSVKQQSLAGPFFLYTSNVDGHFHRQFAPEEVYEIHGNVLRWQCGHPYQCKSGIWDIPSEFTFDIDRTTMLAPNKPNTSVRSGMVPALATAELPLETFKSDKEDEYVAQEYDAGIVRAHFGTNHPSCIFCGKQARPNVLMFWDGPWVKDDREAVYVQWEAAMENVLRENPAAKLTIIEMGCGMRVQSVRTETEQVVSDVRKVGGNATLVRINPDFPESTSDPDNTISIRNGALDSLRKIDRYIDELRAATA